MIKTFFFIIFFGGCTQAEKRIGKESMLMTLPHKSVSCGILSVWEGVKFMDTKDEKVFIGFIHCPENYNDTFFKVNTKYSLQLDIELPDSSKNIIVNSFEKEGLPSFSIKEIKRQF